MSLNVYIARQPIVTVEQKTYAYELLFRGPQEDGSVQSAFNDGMIATTRVIVNALNHIGVTNLVGEHFAFINVNEELLHDDSLFTIPKDRFVIEILENLIVDDAVIERVKQLREMGYRIALDDAHCDNAFLDNFKPLFPHIDILKLDVSLIDKEKLKEHINVFRSYDFELLAEKVESKEDFNYYKALGCRYFQGYFFAKPDIVQKKALDPAYKDIFKLINLLDKDASVQEVSMAFEANPDITLQLLRFMNSGYLDLTTKIRSIAHAITLLGKRPLKQWLLLIAFSKSESAHGGFNSPLITLAQSRAKLMAELMRKFSDANIDPHEAALVGILSLVDVITETSIDVVLAELMVDESIERALLQHTGELGTLLELAIAMENFDITKANILLGNLKLSHENLEKALLESFKL